MRVKATARSLSLIMIIMLAASSTLSLISLAVPAKADPEPPLQEIFNSIGKGAIRASPPPGGPGPDEQPLIETFAPGTYAVEILARWTGSTSDSFGWYPYYPGPIYPATFSYTEIFAATDGIGTTVPFTAPTAFGFYLDRGTALFYTENRWQPDGYDHAWVYQDPNNPNMVYICFEDQLGGGDTDHNDMIVNVTRIYYEAVPVGGVSVSMVRPESDLLGPYVGLASATLVSTVATAFYVKRVKRRKEKP
ncbi:DUF4114 domain-containing protein [Candidatus Bathyarchaeota archaeon]|jgi:hypothetical protein|nr:DUF4114 domain-containing protein [Candidatus Bathyarchaeota archaeon]